MSAGGGSTWFGRRAVEWVLDEAPVPSDQLGTLVAIARRADEHGRGSYQSVPTLAEKTGKSADQVRRDTVKLLELGLIRLGDQTLPERNRVPAGQRPVVYDCALEIKGAKPIKKSRNESGKKKAETPSMDATPRMEATPGMDAGGTPCMEAPWTPGMDATQTKPGTDPLKTLPPTPSEISSPPTTAGLRDGMDSDLEERKTKIVVEVRRIRPKWSAKGCLNAINAELDAGRPLDLVGEVFVLVAKDGVGQSPAWLNQGHGWWDVALKRRADRPRPCARCGGARNVHRDPDDPRSSSIACPDCVVQLGVGEDEAPPPTRRPPPPASPDIVLARPHRHTAGRREDGMPWCGQCRAAWLNGEVADPATTDAATESQPAAESAGPAPIDENAGPLAPVIELDRRRRAS